MRISGKLQICLILAVSTFVWVAASQAQEVGPAVPPATEAQQPPPGEVAAPPVAGNPQDTPIDDQNRWDYERVITNSSGGVVNAHRRRLADDGSTMAREHSVTNPRGEMLQRWERLTAEDGYTYRREHTWTDPDGNLLRRHEMTTTRSDPYNFERQKSMTLRDGRTLNMTRTQTWDGETGSMERTFTGPNGQYRSFQRPWSPEDGPIDPERAITRQRIQTWQSIGQPATGTQASQGTSGLANRSRSKGGLFSRFNPFASKGAPSWGSSRPSGRPSGFTMGSAARGRWGASRQELTRKQPGQSRSGVQRTKTGRRQHSAARSASKSRPGRSR